MCNIGRNRHRIEVLSAEPGRETDPVSQQSPDETPVPEPVGTAPAVPAEPARVLVPAS
jgi:hypothetical protein